MAVVRMNKPIITALVIFLSLSCMVIRASEKLPAIHQQGDVTYLIGGMEEVEMKAIRQESSKWPLQIEFPDTLRNNAYWIKPVQLIIKSKRNDNTVFYGPIDGPIALIKLAPGTYELVATYQDQVKAREVKIIKGKLLQIKIQWNTPGEFLDFPYYQPWGFWF